MQREEAGNPDFNVDRPQPLVRAIMEPPATAAVAPQPMAASAAALPQGVAGPMRQLPSGSERTAIPQEQIALSGESLGSSRVFWWTSVITVTKDCSQLSVGR